MNFVKLQARAPKVQEKFIHLLYAPTNFCNMSCQYCYLGTGTDEKTDTSQAVNTLEFALNAFLESDITPFNISFHGGEATAIPSQTLVALFAMVEKYYQTYGNKIKGAGFPLNPLHIKTNLYNFDKLYDYFVKHKVSINASVDLPLSLHEKYRLDKRGKSTLNKIKRNLVLLSQYPHNNKISCVMTREHLSHMDEFVRDIKKLHYEIGLDMTKFNIMFGFDSDKNTEKFDGKITGTDMLKGPEQLEIYHRLKQEFQNTELEKGLKLH